MEEKKKVSPILIVILSILGICLVGFCVWYGVNYFKGEDKPIEEPSSQIYEDSRDDIDDDLEIVGVKIKDNKAELDYNFYLKSEELIKKTRAEVLDVKSDNFKFDNDILVVSETWNTDDGETYSNEYKLTGVTGEVKLAYLDSACCGWYDIYVINNGGDLYYGSFEDDEATHKLSKIKENIISIKTKDGGGIYLLDESGNYYKEIYDAINDTTSFEKIVQEKTFVYSIPQTEINFDLNSVKNNEIYFDNISIDSIYCDNEGPGVESICIVIDKDKYVYEYQYDKTAKLNKILNKKVKNISSKKLERDYSKITIEFE